MCCKALFLAGLLVLSVSCGGSPSSQGTPDSTLPSVGDRLSETARTVLEAAEVFEILTIDPNSGWKKPPEGAKLFHNYVELERATVADDATRRRILHLIYEGILENDDTVAACFNPRHGVHTVAGDHEVDLVICYECFQMHVHVDGEQQACITGESVAPALSRIYQDHGLQIPK